MKKILLIHFIFWCSLFGVTLKSLMAQRAVNSAVQSTAGGAAQSSDHSLLATVGQLSSPETASSEQHILYSGFIYTVGFATFDAETASFHLSYGKTQQNYRLISIPAILNDPDPAAILEDDLGKYDKKHWRLFDCQDGKKANVEFPNTRDLTPGVGLFIIVKESGDTIDIENGAWLETISYSIKLQKGWNFIGNPFNMEIPASKIKLQSDDSNDALVLNEFIGKWVVETKTTPWHGYAVAVNGGNASLTFDPFSTPGGKLERPAIEVAQGEGWQIQISAQIGEVRDECNFAGVAKDAKLERDPLDWFEPPVIGDYISLYFHHPEWHTFLTIFTTDYRSPESDGYTWDVEIQSNLTDPATIAFSGLETVPSNYEVWLVDEAAKISQNIRSNNSYSVALPGEDQPRQLKLLVGNHEFIRAQVIELQSLPETYELSQNFPNPFNPSTTIRFGLPEAGKVTLKIFNLLGEEVVALINNELRKAGYHVIVWDGRNSQGHVVANGMYVYQLQSGSRTIAKKMALMK